MTEPKYRYRIPPCPAYDLPGMESWLEDMAAKGLHLAPDGFFCGVATFEEGPPRKEKFRLEATATQKGLFSEEYEPDGDSLELHQQMGWTYRARRDQFHIYSSSDPDAPELNTDPQVQAITMAALSKYLRSSLLHTLILLLIYALLYFGDMVISAAVVLGTWTVLLLALLLLWDLGLQLRTLTVLSRYRKQLLRGEPLPHRSAYRQRGWRYLAAGGVRRALWIVFLCMMLSFLGTYITEDNYTPLEDWTDPLPFATLADLYPGAEVERKDWMLHSRLTRWEDLLSPENYDLSEYAEVTQNGETFSCYLTVEYHETRFEWTARMLAREFVSQSGANPVEQTLSKLFGQDIVTAAELSIPDADYAASYIKSREEPYLVLQQDNIVLRLHLDVLGEGPQLSAEELARMVLAQIR